MALVVNKNDIPRSVAERAYAFSSFTPEKRADSVQEDYVSHMESVYAELGKIAKTDEQRAVLREEFKRYQTTYIAKRIAVLNAQSRTASPMITGPSKFPTERNQKALKAEQNRRDELLEWDKKTQRAMIKKIDPTRFGISSDRADATDLLQQKIDKAGRMQATMVESNKIVRDRKLSKEEKIEKLQTVDGISKAAAEGLMEPDFVGRLGFASFQLQNNSANIKRMKERIEQLEKSRADDTRDMKFANGKVVDNVEDNRLQIFFDAKPDRETITKLKRNGFRWTPSIGAWQRFRSQDALAAMQRAIGVEFKKPVSLEPPPPAPTPIEPTLESALEPPKEAKPAPVTPEVTAIAKRDKFLQEQALTRNKALIDEEIKKAGNREIGMRVAAGRLEKQVDPRTGAVNPENIKDAKLIREATVPKVAIPKAPVTPKPKVEKATKKEFAKTYPYADTTLEGELNRIKEAGEFGIEKGLVTREQLNKKIKEFEEVIDRTYQAVQGEKPKAEEAQSEYKELMKPRLEAHDKEIKAVNDKFMAGEMTPREMEQEHKKIHAKTNAVAATMRRRVWGKYAETLPTQAELEKVQRMRSPRSQASDLARKHSVVIGSDSPRVATWLHDQGTADITGIDTPSVSKRGGLGRKGTPRITPKTPRLRR